MSVRKRPTNCYQETHVHTYTPTHIIRNGDTALMVQCRSPHLQPPLRFAITLHFPGKWIAMLAFAGSRVTRFLRARSQDGITHWDLLYRRNRSECRGTISLYCTGTPSTCFISVSFFLILSYSCWAPVLFFFIHRNVLG